MRSPTGREIQVFVAGALALDGLHIILGFMRGSIPTSDYGSVVAGVMAGLALPLGIGILMKSTFAVRVAYFYFGLGILLWCAVLIALRIGGIAVFQYTWIRRTSISGVIQLILLLLLVWSRSKRLRDESAA